MFWGKKDGEYMRILHINSVCGVTGTGRIVTDLCEGANARGHQSVAAYGEHKFKNQSSKINMIPIGSSWDCRIHGLLTRVFDLQGFGSKRATKEFLKEVDKFQPEVIHLHNLHGYYVNIELLFDYIKRKKIKTVWTLHDCWAMTGHCVYFDNISCNKWKMQCHHCQLKKQYPASWLVDNSSKNYLKKKAIFQGVEQMTVIVPSEWLAEKVRQSFLRDYKIRVIYNGIDLEKYHPVRNNFKNKYGIGDKVMILGVANVWDERKGLGAFLELDQLLDDNYQIVLIGLNKKQIQKIPSTIIGMERTDTVEALVQAYSAADVFVTPSTEETFGLTVVEAMACGTWPIVYEGTACAEVVRCGTGKIVPRNVEKIREAIEEYLIGDQEKQMEKYAQFFSNKRFADEVLEVYRDNK